MNKEIAINFITIIDLFNKMLEDEKVYLKTNNIDLQCIDNKYIIIADLLKELSNENYTCIYFNCDNTVSKKVFKQFIILLRDISSKYSKAKNIIELITSKDDNYISLIEMSNILLKKNILDDKLKIINEKFKNSSYRIDDYFWINNCINNIKDSNIINYYFKYKKFNKSNRFKDLCDDISYDKIIKIQQKLDSLLNNKFTLIPPIYMNEFTDDFINSNFSLDITEVELAYHISNLKIANNLETKKLKWYHYLNRKKYSKIQSYNRNILKQCNTLKKTIFNQYKENIESLTLYVKSFDFLKEVIKKSYFNKIYDYLYDENDMFIFLKDISNNLSIYKEFLSIRKQINNLSQQELELLDFCYNKDNNIDSYKEELLLLPSYLILFYFKGCDYTFNKYDIKKDTLGSIIKQLNNDLNMLSKLIYEHKFNLFSYLKIVKNISKIEEDEAHNSYILKKVGYDDCIRYIDESLKNDSTNLEIYSSDYKIIKFIKNIIIDLGYKIIENFKLDLVNLELVVFNPNNTNLIIYIFIDAMIANSYDSIKKLCYITEKNIPIIYCWSDEFCINKNLEVSRLKLKLKNLLL